MDPMRVGSSRCVLVTGLPTTASKQEVWIHFQKHKNGGGDVEDVILLKDGSAVVVFEREQVVSTVLSREHQLNGVKLNVNRRMPHPPSESSPDVFSKVTALVNLDAFPYSADAMRVLLDGLVSETGVKWHSREGMLAGSFLQIKNCHTALSGILNTESGVNGEASNTHVHMKDTADFGSTFNAGTRIEDSSSGKHLNRESSFMHAQKDTADYNEDVMEEKQDIESDINGGLHTTHARTNALESDKLKTTDDNKTAGRGKVPSTDGFDKSSLERSQLDFVTGTSKRPAPSTEESASNSGKSIPGDMGDERQASIETKKGKSKDNAFMKKKAAQKIAPTFKKIPVGKEGKMKAELKTGSFKDSATSEQKLPTESSNSSSFKNQRITPTITATKKASEIEEGKCLDPKEFTVKSSAKFFEVFKKAYKTQLKEIEDKMKVKTEVHNMNSKVTVHPCDGCKAYMLNAATEQLMEMYQEASETMETVKFEAAKPEDGGKLRQIVQNHCTEQPVVVEIGVNRKTWEMIGLEQDIEKVMKSIEKEVKIRRELGETGTAEEESGEESISDNEQGDGGSKDVIKYKKGTALEDIKDKLEHVLGAVKVSVYQGDITDQRVDAIVNAANVDLVHGSGVAGAILEKGGWAIQEESYTIVKRYGRLQIGDAVLTTSGKLPCKGVIHTVGPEWWRFKKDEAKKILHRACLESFFTAEGARMCSVALPAISSGIYGVPKEVCAEVMFNAFEEYSRNVAESSSVPVVDIRFVNNDAPTVKVFREEFKKRYGKSEPRSAEYKTKASPTVTTGPQYMYHKAGDQKSEVPASSLKTKAISLKEKVADSFRKGKSSTQEQDGARNASRDSGTQSPEDRKDTGSLKEAEKAPKAQAAQVVALPPSQSSLPFGGARRKVRKDARNSDDKTEKKHPGGDTAKQMNSQIPFTHGGAPRPNRATGQRSSKSHDDVKECPVCRGPYRNPRETQCGHTFCAECLRKALKERPICPVCRDPQDNGSASYPEPPAQGSTLHQRATQPDGMMMHRSELFSLPGYESEGTIVIQYSFQGGIQGERQPHPGQPYQGTDRTAYLPDNKEGREVLRLLEKAFDAKLVFRIGYSMTSNRDNQTVWNILHKSCKNGGPSNFGYPDPTYLSDVKQQLAYLGIR